MRAFSKRRIQAATRRAKREIHLLALLTVGLITDGFVDLASLVTDGRLLGRAHPCKSGDGEIGHGDVRHSLRHRRIGAAGHRTPIPEAGGGET